MKKTAVGDRYVYENMKENDFVLGGEQSGHIIFRKYAHTGDGLITALMLMQVMIDPVAPERAGVRRIHVSAGAEERPGGR